ncbi:MAG TPA: phosphatase [Cyanothece sp. UBA12306]|nr:phosphatase [Cyanothece sp. UBA12306]
MNIKRREFLAFLGIGFATTACNSMWKTNLSAKTSSVVNGNLPFSNFIPIKYPIPLEINQLNIQQQKKEYQSYKVEDDLVLPKGFEYQVIASWGDKVGNSRFGYNNDYVALIETAPNQGYLVVNFEYVSPTPWLQGYDSVIGKDFHTDVITILEKAEKKQESLNIFGLENNQPIKVKFQQFFGEILIDQGIGIISVRRNQQGKWERTYSKEDRRITGISGWQDGHYLSVTGPAQAIFNKDKGLGYIDNLKDKIIGTFANCAGGKSPWGTVFSAEENFQNYVPEAVMADGTSFFPESLPVSNLTGQGNPFGLAGNKYGWMVEVDPTNPNDYGTKHTWLGRFRHEAVAIRAEGNQPAVFYSGCDRTGGHLYKFVTQEKVVNPQDKGNSALLKDGMLYVAKMEPDGTGKWLPLQADTPINPTSLNKLAGGLLLIPNRDRQQGGMIRVDKQEDLDKFSQQYDKLGDLYIGNTPEEIQGAILIDAHYASNVIGGTSTARPEDVALHPMDQSLVIAFTAAVSGSSGSPDKDIFSDQQGRLYEYGCLMRLKETDNQPSAMTFTWEIIGAGGEPANGGLGFAMPDNLEFDADGNLWMVTDMPGGLLNQPSRGQRNTIGVLGNNAIWYLPLSGENAGNAYPFGTIPMEAEACGLCFSKEQNSLFLSVQHPGEVTGTRKDMTATTTNFSILTTDGEEFVQKRTIPQGSNWPSLEANQPPKPSLVVITPTSDVAV